MEIKVKGRITNDPELKFVTENQLPLATFSLAYTPRTKKNDEWVEGETMWFQVSTFGKKAETLVDLLKKGDEVLVIGTLKQNTYKGRDGVEKTSLQINAAEIGVVPRPAHKQPRSTANPNTDWDAPSW